MAPIDRRALVDRYAVEVTEVDPRSPLSVGNGELCCTVDVTGLQTFPRLYDLGTMAQWGWHSTPPPDPAPTLADGVRRYDTPRGPVPYVDLADFDAATPGQRWLRANPHRLDLARIGLVVDGTSPDPVDLREARQRLDLWTGTITSAFLLAGTPFRVTTCCHPEVDALGFRVASPGRFAVRLAFPYGSESWHDAADWDSPDRHESVLHVPADGARIDRRLDEARFAVRVHVNAGATVRRTGPHEFLVETGAGVLELGVRFGVDPDPVTFTEALLASERWWPRFWSSGGVVEVDSSADARAPELQRRIVLSQYLTAIQCAGSLPPAETGLTANSWRGRFHLEMHWWHGAHLPLWGRAPLLVRSLDWYARTLDVARATARAQGYRGARWPKQVGPDGRESPSPIGTFLVWQQPHLIHLAELVRRSGDRGAVARYGECVLETAAFMADFAVATEAGYALGPPLVPAQESYYRERARVVNPTFELAYWAWALRVAQRWRVWSGSAEDPLWTAVADGLVRPTVRDGRYAAIGTPPWTVREDHPSMLYALGFVPETGVIDHGVMRATLHHVLADWDWPSAWGWDFPAMAMTATRLGEPATAVDVLLLDTPKNTYLPNGHNRQSDLLPVYLPGNGGLLAAVALMAAGWDGSPPTPGFPPDRWTVRHEGLVPAP
ncbi:MULTISPECIES: hypothetical protein [Saccharothrix]|uniref:hypothetical protein n=1 Tax=Saccharothrix TaxID=2071 RepID=UPI00093E5278|nr:hypothetical protein [Saccharothrix sp. CB00851]OKI18492.1 hypothetical protein A6A25_39725 [Saccharothrix sp. CB00851]